MDRNINISIKTFYFSRTKRHNKDSLSSNINTHRCVIVGQPHRNRIPMDALWEIICHDQTPFKYKDRLSRFRFFHNKDKTVYS